VVPLLPLGFIEALTHGFYILVFSLGILGMLGTSAFLVLDYLLSLVTFYKESFIGVFFLPLPFIVAFPFMRSFRILGFALNRLGLLLDNLDCL
jgi:hypothetical protein